MEFCFRIYIDEDAQRINMDKLYFHPDALPCNSYIPEQNSSDTNIWFARWTLIIYRLKLWNQTKPKNGYKCLQNVFLTWLKSCMHDCTKIV